jgi:hypothetical protein
MYYFSTQLQVIESVYIHRIRQIVLGKLAIIVAVKIVTVVSLDSRLVFCDLI